MFMFLEPELRPAQKNTIPQIIESMSKERTAYQVFRDWCECFAIAIQNGCTIHDEIWQKREELYLQTINKYSESDRQKMSHMCWELTMLFEDNPEDHLGKIYMESGAGSKKTGQFFTPYHISQMTAKLALMQYDKPPYTLNEPSCGGGGMIIAFAKAMEEKGMNYQRELKVQAQDLDWLGVHMCYIQLSLMGIDAVVVQGDTLAEPGELGKDKSRIFRTPKNMGVLP